jgi:hypothetical protein
MADGDTTWLSVAATEPMQANAVLDFYDSRAIMQSMTF